MTRLNNETRSIKCNSIVFISVLLLLSPIIQINTIGLFWNDSSNNVDRIDDLINDEIGLKQSISNSNSDLTLSLSSSRSPDQETEPNNDISTSISNANELKDNTDMEGQLTYTSDELDWFYMELTGGGQSSIDSVTITPSFQNKTELHDRAVGFKLKAYTMSDSELYILEYKAFGSQWAVNNDSSILWRNSTSLVFNADQTGRYFIKLNAVYIIDSGTNQVIDPDVKINYTLEVSISSISNLDNNNDIFNSTTITGPIENKTITQAFDHWDWYKIDTLTQNREVNVSLSLKINNAFNSSTQPPGHKVNLIGVLKCFDLDTSTWLKNVRIKDSRETDPTIDLYLTARFSTVYLGIHSQQLVYVDSWIPDSIDCGESNLNYDIDSLELTLINTKPKLGSWNATPRKGDVQDSYHFDISYLDENNDEPLFVNVTIDNANYTLSKSSVPYNDGDYTNGERYEVTIPGSEFSKFSDIPHDSFIKLGFSFSTQDYFTELSLPMRYVSLNSQTYIEVIDNVVPSVRSSVPDNWSIKEDSSPVYINLFDIYHDPESKKYADEVSFEVWDNINSVWTTSTIGTDNITVTVMENNTLMVIPNKNKFGTDFIKLIAYDVEYQLGNLSAGSEYDLKIVTEPVNDKPIIIQPIDYIVTNNTAMKEDEYINITFQANDGTDKFSDPIIFSIDILEKIPLLGSDPDKYNYQFSATTGNLSFLPDNDLVGKYQINITATDQGVINPIELSSEKTFTLEILNTNDAPIARIKSPINNATYNTSTNIWLNAINSTDDDSIYGDKLYYYWYLDNETEEDLIIDRPIPVIEIPPIKTSGKHTLILKVADKDHALGRANITIWIISLIDDIHGGEDFDNDGMPDEWEMKHFKNLDFGPNEDIDNDDFTNLEEYLGEDEKPGGGDSSDPLDNRSIPGDIDSDSLPDIWERSEFGTLTQGADDDPDGDKYTNYEEYIADTDPLEFTESKKEGSKKEVTDYTIILIIVLVVVLIVIVLLVLQRKKQAEEEKAKESGEKQPLYTPEPMPIIPFTPPTPGTPPGNLPTAQPMRIPGPAAPGTMPPQVPHIPQQTTQMQIQPQKLALPPTGQVMDVKTDQQQKK